MLRTRTYLDKSSTRGIGLFSAQDIAKGEIVGVNNENYSIKRWSENEWEELIRNLTPESACQIKKYAVKDKNEGCYFLNLDNTRFINHSDDPNIATIGTNDIAVKAIKAGDELLIDYTTFYDPEYLKEIMELE